MFNPEEIKKVLGNDPNSQKKLQELLKLLEKNPELQKMLSQPPSTKSSDDPDTNPTSTNSDDKDLRKKLLKQRVNMMKNKRLNITGKTAFQEKLKQQIATPNKSNSNSKKKKKPPSVTKLESVTESSDESDTNSSPATDVTDPVTITDSVTEVTEDTSTPTPNE